MRTTLIASLMLFTMGSVSDLCFAIELPETGEDPANSIEAYDYYQAEDPANSLEFIAEPLNDSGNAAASSGEGLEVSMSAADAAPAPTSTPSVTPASTAGSIPGGLYSIGVFHCPMLEAAALDIVDECYAKLDGCTSSYNISQESDWPMTQSSYEWCLWGAVYHATHKVRHLFQVYQASCTPSAAGIGSVNIYSPCQ